jgi:diguanylate cyclase (GGDEF)-like protein
MVHVPMATHEQLIQIINIQSEIAKLGLDLGGVMQYVVEHTLTLIEADGAAIELAEGSDMAYRAAAGIARKQLGLRLKIETSLSGLCVKVGKALSCTDSETDPRVDKMACRKVGLRSMIVIPLKHKDRTVGVLKAMSAKPHKFSQVDIDLLSMLSGVVAAAMYFSTKYDSDSLFIKATHDGMTGLANRALFMDRLRATLSRLDRSHFQFGILILDMDDLKHINDTYGHRIGDAVIIEFSARLKNSIRDMDTVARLGGDEFGIILNTVDDVDEINAAMQRIDTEISQPFNFENIQYQLKASIGSAFVPQDGSELDKLLHIADQRMYAVKQSRKVK